MPRAVADTHTVIWYLKANPQLSPSARLVIDDAAAVGDSIIVSAITFIEITYLVEKGRIDADTLDVLLLAVSRPNAVLVEAPVDRSIALALQSVPRSEVPDMPDRIIAATAVAYGVPVISRDGKIRLSRIQTIW
jgi:PIN domain nuclease of toxin-antitoxin system